MIINELQRGILGRRTKKVQVQQGEQSNNASFSAKFAVEGWATQRGEKANATCYVCQHNVLRWETTLAASPRAAYNGDIFVNNFYRIKHCTNATAWQQAVSPKHRL